MEQQYTVTGKGQVTGKVCVTRLGLYYHFQCRCRLPSEDIYRLMVTCGAARENLGVLIPSGGEFILNTKLPVKQLGAGEMSFSIIPKQDQITGTFVPIRAEEPFAYISSLKKSFLVLKDGQTGIMLKTMQEC